MFLEGDSIQTGFTLGGAFDISKMVSIAGGVRYVDATQSLAGVADLLTAFSTVTRFEIDLEREAAGWSYFFGVNVAPVKKLNIGFLYMSNTKLDWETDVIKDDVGVTPALGWDEKQRTTFPVSLAWGWLTASSIRSCSKSTTPAIWKPRRRWTRSASITPVTASIWG